MKHKQKDEARRVTEAVIAFERRRQERAMQNVRVLPLTTEQREARLMRLEKLRGKPRTKREWENDVTATKRTTSV